MVTKIPAATAVWTKNWRRQKANAIPIVIGRPTQETGYSLEQLIQTLVQDLPCRKKKEKRCDSLFSFFFAI